MTSLNYEIELIGVSNRDDLRTAAATTLTSLGIGDCHVAIELVDGARIHQLNREHRGVDSPTDVLSFPIDEIDPGEQLPTERDEQSEQPPRELGDVVICPEYTTDLTEADVHGVLHLCGFDHETDDGEMLALQDQIVDQLADSA